MEQETDKTRIKKTLEGYLFNRIEELGNKKYNHVGCEGINENFGDFISQFVPEIGTKRKVRCTIEILEDPEKIENK